MRRSVAHLSGSSAKMRYSRKLAHEILRQKAPHFFQTCSYADRWWPALKRLLFDNENANPTFFELKSKIKANPHICLQYWRKRRGDMANF